MDLPEFALQVHLVVFYDLLDPILRVTHKVQKLVQEDVCITLLSLLKSVESVETLSPLAILSLASFGTLFLARPFHGRAVDKVILYGELAVIPPLELLFGLVKLLLENKAVSLVAQHKRLHAFAPRSEYSLPNCFAHQLK